MESDTPAMFSFGRRDGDRILHELEARGLAVVRTRGEVVVLAAPNVQPTLAHLEIETDALRVLIRRAAPLKPKHLKRSSRVADQRISASLYAAAIATMALPGDQQADRVVALLARARAELIGADGIKAGQLAEMRGRPARGGLPGLGRRR
jgi:hypothetical protein